MSSKYTNREVRIDTRFPINKSVRFLAISYCITIPYRYSLHSEPCRHYPSCEYQCA